MAERSKAAVAVNGTFFNAYSTTDVKIPYGYIVKSGKVIYKASGDQRAVFVYTNTGDALIADGETELKKLLDKGLVESALQAGPRLVRNGKVDTNPTAEGFKDPKVLTNRAARSAVGITAEGKLLIATASSATIKELAEVMVKLGAIEAMNLDGGASSGLYANGKYITTPGRDLSNALVAVFPS
ncbi:phosphodiester glycosidase family protein [Marinicrinis lubricantis]